METLRPTSPTVKTTHGRTRLERETSVIWNEAEPLASVWTFSVPVQRRLARLGYEAPRPEGPYFVPKALVVIRRPGTRRPLSARALDALRQGRAVRGPARISAAAALSTAREQRS